MTRERLPFKDPGGLLALAALALALVVVNSPLAWLYDLVHHTPISVHVGAFVIDKPLIQWINEGLMVFFFLLVSLEIKRELLEGHLARPAVAAIPAAAALGGMAVPAAIYAAFTWSEPAALRGWAMPTATDIVLALAVLSMRRGRIVDAQRVLLTAIAVLDDLGGILIISLFYTDALVIPLLLLAGVAGAGLLVLNVFKVQRIAAFGAVGTLLWLTILESGVNATLTGVVVGAAIPLHAKDGGESPLRALERRLYPWVALAVVPLFVFFNAGLPMTDLRWNVLITPVGLAVVLGLTLGKPAGIVGGAWLATRLGLARLPPSLNWTHVIGIGMLGGIGFTVSLFLASLAFADAELARIAKLGILVGSSVSAAIGLLVLGLQRHESSPP